MFRAKHNAFETVKCPNYERYGLCRVVNCIFNHEVDQKRRRSEAPPVEKELKRARSIQDSPATDQKASSSSSLSPSEEPTKEKPLEDVKFLITKALTTGINIPRNHRDEAAKRIAYHIRQNKLSPTVNRLTIDKEYEFASSSNSMDEYQEKVAKYIGKELEATSDPRLIMPKEVHPSPAMLPQRKKFIEHLAAAFRKNPQIKTPVLAGIEEEFKIASVSSNTTYNLAIKRRLFELNNPDRVKKPQRVGFSKAEVLAELNNMAIDREMLIKYGYFMDIPEPIDHVDPVRTCHRCKLPFNLSDALKKVDCRYHSGRTAKNAMNVRVHQCCGGVIGETDTEPCTKSDYHVFYWQAPNEMHHVIPFVNTKQLWGTRKGSLEAVGIDCEMGFTTNGFELLRVTAMDFFSGEEVFDILVKPKGEVLDLNTRWSGIAEIKPEAVSFEDSMALLGEVVDSRTIFVGHGLENDMNAMRLIHERVVDTAILFPRNKTSPTFRFALKNLAFKYLGRNIQTGQHDSGEDSLAAIDVTKHFINKELMQKAENEEFAQRNNTANI